MTSTALRSIFVSILIMGMQLTSALGAETKPSDWDISCGGPYNLCGFVERDSGKERIAMTFEWAFPFSEGLAGVRIEGKFGFIDQTGKIVIPPRFDMVGKFRHGHAEVLLGAQAGIIDRVGGYVLKPAYAGAIPFGKSAALVVLPSESLSPYLTGDERPVTESVYFGLDETWFDLVDLSTGTTLKSGLQISKFDFDKFVWAKTAGDQGYGLLAPDGSWKVEPRYMEARPLQDGRSLVCNFEGEQTRNRRRSARCGSLDENGDPALPVVPYYINDYRNGIYSFRRGKKTGLLNEQGELLGGRLFDDVNFTEPGLVLEVLENGEWLGLTREGKTVANPGGQKVLLACPSGLKFVARAGGIEVFKDGRRTAPYLFEESYLGTNCDFPKSVTLEGKYGFVDSNGKLLFEPPFFESIYAFVEGHAGARTDGKWGIVDETGKFTVKPRYDDLQPDSDGLFAVKLGKENFWIDRNGERRPEPYRADKRRKKLLCRSTGGKVVGKKVDGQMLWGLADAAGRTFIEPKYRAISCFENGLAWVPFDDRKVWCPIDRSEKIRDGMRCVTNWIASRIFDAGPEKMSDDPYESGVLWMRANLDYGMGLRDKPPRIVGGRSF